MRTLAGYTDRLSVAPGETISFKISAEGQSDTYRASLVRLISTDDHPDGPGVVEQPFKASIDGTYPARRQSITAGSYGQVEHPTMFSSISSFTLQAFIWPTLLGRRRQTLLGVWNQQTGRGFAMEINEQSCLSLQLGNGLGDVEVVQTDIPLIEREWTLVAVTYEAQSGSVALYQHSLPYPPYASRLVDRHAVVAPRRPGSDATTFTIAARVAGTRDAPTMAGHYNGKIEAPCLCARALPRQEILELAWSEAPSKFPQGVIAAWDFSLRQDTDLIIDRSENRLEGRLHNLPTRAVKGRRWSGEFHDWRTAPEQYAAIHFHDDDLCDAGWANDFSFSIPHQMASGVYAARLEAEDSLPAHVVFFVRPPRGRATAKVAYLASTATYMAYANQSIIGRDRYYEMAMASLPVILPDDLFLHDHPEFGKSLYDRHSDGSGVLLLLSFETDAEYVAQFQALDVCR